MVCLLGARIDGARFKTILVQMEVPAGRIVLVARIGALPAPADGIRLTVIQPGTI